MSLIQEKKPFEEETNKYDVESTDNDIESTDNDFIPQEHYDRDIEGYKFKNGEQGYGYYKVKKYLPSNTFTGEKPGYVLKTTIGEDGVPRTGYYLDENTKAAQENKHYKAIGNNDVLRKHLRGHNDEGAFNMKPYPSLLVNNQSNVNNPPEPLSRFNPRYWLNKIKKTKTKTKGKKINKKNKTKSNKSKKPKSNKIKKIKSKKAKK